MNILKNFHEGDNLITSSSMYFTTEIIESATLLPHQMDDNITEHLLKYLKDNLEGKISKNGYIVNINRIIDHDYGIIDEHNNMGSIVYKNVKFDCYVCLPMQDLKTVFRFEDSQTGGLLRFINGPVHAMMYQKNIGNGTSSKFEYKQKDNLIVHTESKKILKLGDYVKVRITTFKMELGSNRIVAFVNILDFANDTEIEQFEHEERLFNNIDSIEETAFI